MQAIFSLTQTIYWSGLSTWFGAAFFIAIASPVIFRVIREMDPTLPTVLSVNLDHQHATLLSSTVVARLMQTLTRVSLGCCVAVLVGLVAQGVIIRPPFGSAGFVQLVIRASLYFFATAVLVYDWRIVAPRLFAARQEFIDHADEPDVANAAGERFEQYSRESLNVLFMQVLLLLGLILFGASLSYTA